MLNLVTELKPGIASTPLSFNEGVAVFMLCKREKAKIDLPSREDVERALSKNYLDHLASAICCGCVAPRQLNVVDIMSSNFP